LGHLVTLRESFCDQTQVTGDPFVGLGAPQVIFYFY